MRGNDDGVDRCGSVVLKFIVYVLLKWVSFWVEEVEKYFRKGVEKKDGLDLC